MKCGICKKEPPDVNILHRINKKGVPGIWRCENCMTAEQAETIDPLALLIVEDNLRRDNEL